MSSLKDQLLKAGLVSAKQAREADQQQRRERKRSGRRRSDVERDAEVARDQRGAEWGVGELKREHTLSCTFEQTMVL